MFNTCSIALLAILIALNASANSLKTVIGENMSPPWYFPESSSSQRGITPDYLKEIEKKLGQTVEILILPKFRIRDYYANNKVDFNCYTNPEWAGPESKNFQWSHTLFSVKNILVSNKGPVQSIESLRSERIGTVLKYSYPSVEKRFQSGQFIRDDSPNEDGNLKKLESMRFNYAIVDATHLGYYLMNNPNSIINPHGFVLEEIPVKCWVRKGSSLKLADLNSAIDSLKRDGTFDKIFRKYRRN